MSYAITIERGRVKLSMPPTGLTLTVSIDGVTDIEWVDNDGMVLAYTNEFYALNLLPGDTLAPLWECIELQMV